MVPYLPNFRSPEPREQRLQRLLEMVPGLLMWFTFIGLAAFSYLFPLAMAIFAILFGFYWLIRVTYFTGLMVIAYLRLRREQGIDWLDRVKGVGDLVSYGKKLDRDEQRLEEKTTHIFGLERKLIARQLRHLQVHRGEVRLLQERGVAVKSWTSVYHMVVIATYREDFEILDASLSALMRAHYPREHIIVVLATEEREGAKAVEKARRLKEKFGQSFLAFVTTCHPDGIEGEARVKAANITWASREMRMWLDARRIAYEDVIISVFDADTCAEPKYLACLTYQFITRPNRMRCSYQPLPMYNNNIWDAPVFSRVAAMVTSYWQMVQSIRPDLLITFSSHAMCFQALVDVDYWPVDVVSDDSVIFYRCFLRYNGDYRTVPMFVAVHMDANLGKNYWHTFVSLYKQVRRWAWGAENFPLLVRGFLRNRTIPLRTKLRFTFQLLESHYTWSTAAIILTLYVWLPLWLGGDSFRGEVLAYNLPQVTKWMFRIGAVSMLFSAFLGIVILPPRPAHYSWRRWIWMVAQWLLVPIYYVVLVALPAIDAQTRMMFAKYLSFGVTEKHRGNAAPRSTEKDEGVARHA